MSRKLASIQRIWKIEPIEGADRIELAYVLGWQCVVNKGQFKPMDLAVYFEICLSSSLSTTAKSKAQKMHIAMCCCIICNN